MNIIPVDNHVVEAEHGGRHRPNTSHGNSSITELLGAGATGNDWSALAGVLLRSRTEAETLHTGFCRNQSQLYVPAYK
ncbi:hypothetical protein T05_12586 [Trichinella murrelli]|uniref:Uncharacterized protein n=1 Tax=Trichinella murrelli TaxID=144512 RepID=A0A0V0UEQ9_9BILA|nr:hypothetical protein T05_12586 [Trichinella murrelli]